MLKVSYLLLLIGVSLSSCGQQQNQSTEMDTSGKVQKTELEWKNQLTPMQFYVTRQSGTERAFAGELTDEFSSGTYFCVCCNSELFRSNTKFHSGCGWPSFYDKSKSNNIKEYVDKNHGMIRTEVRCSKCEAHLGHVFNDGPKPSGLRYCINSASLRFEKD